MSLPKLAHAASCTSHIALPSIFGTLQKRTKTNKNDFLSKKYKFLFVIFHRLRISFISKTVLNREIAWFEIYLTFKTFQMATSHEHNNYFECTQWCQYQTGFSIRTSVLMEKWDRTIFYLFFALCLFYSLE